jgi:phosphopantothenoylcysteine decarboxylase/phosphopantothenate--cysteine ligase
MADNLLSLVSLAVQCPLLLAPAMDGGMLAHPATQANLEILRQRGATILGPAEGHLASGLTGPGRMVEPLELLGYIRLALGRSGPLAGCRVIVTAGGTQEPLDPVRTLTNRSSGKQGFALAQAALDLGAQVTLISAPVSLDTPPGARRLEVTTAQEMLSCILDELPGTDVLVMAAAVADFRPAAVAAQKIKKEGTVPPIQLERTVDILRKIAEVRSFSGWPRLSVGFAAESQDLLANARQKLESKQLDMIVANDISAHDAGFSVDTNRVTLLYAPNPAHIALVEPLELMSKEQVAQVVWERVTTLLASL